MKKKKEKRSHRKEKKERAKGGILEKIKRSESRKIQKKE